MFTTDWHDIEDIDIGSLAEPIMSMIDLLEVSFNASDWESMIYDAQAIIEFAQIACELESSTLDDIIGDIIDNTESSIEGDYSE